MPKKTRKTVIKKKEKKWFKVFAPALLGEAEVGRTLGIDKKHILNRTIKTSLGLIMGEPSKHKILITLKIKEINENKAITELVKYRLDPVYKKRMVRRNTSLILNNQKLLTKDGKNIIIQSFLITSFRAKGKQKKDLRKALNEEVKELVRENTFNDLILKTINKKIQNNLKNKIKKVYPLNYAEIDKIVLK